MHPRVEPENFWRNLTNARTDFPPGFSFQLWQEMLERIDASGVKLYDAALGFLHIAFYFFNADNQMRMVSAGFGDCTGERITKIIDVLKVQQKIPVDNAENIK